MLSGLCLVLARCLEVREETYVDVEGILAADLVTDLSDRFDERLALDVTDRAADLSDYDVCAALAADVVDESLYLVSDVRDDLYR